MLTNDTLVMPTLDRAGVAQLIAQERQAAEDVAYALLTTLDPKTEYELGKYERTTAMGGLRSGYELIRDAEYRLNELQIRRLTDMTVALYVERRVNSLILKTLGIPTAEEEAWKLLPD